MSFETLITKAKNKSVTKPIQLKLSAELLERVRRFTQERGISIKDFAETSFEEGIQKVIELTSKTSSGNTTSSSRRGRRPKEALAS